MYRGGKGFDEGRGGGGKNGWNGYRRDYRQAYRGGWGDRMDNSSHMVENSVPSEPAPAEHEKSSEQSQSSSSSEAVVARLEKRLASVQKEFKHAVQEKNKKENDKFDLIFGILSELQGRQAHLEELINGLWNQHSGMASNHMWQPQQASNHMGQPQQAQQMQFGSMNVSQTFGHMGGQMSMHANGNMNVQQQQMQQFSGMMQPDGSQTMFAVQQVSHPVAGMQPAGQQMMAPAGQMQAMMAPAGQMQPQMLPGAQPQAGSASKEQPASRTAAAPGPAGRPAGGKRLANASMERASEAVNGTGASNRQQAEADPVDASDEAAPVVASSTDSSSHYTKNRTWRVINLQDEGELKETGIPCVSVAKAFCPDIASDPREDIVVRWLKNGDLVQQIGHSKKIRGFVVMPVRLFATADGTQCNEDEQDGWVTRCSPDKVKDAGEGVWFEEVRDS
mmetsp:Transcript_158943/g.281737  ORF Transcript_158943/g.281737 Transcript_158943/m.281737 type:complete len:448 (-) Transcript_158943:42-1385(-)